MHELLAWLEQVPAPLVYLGLGAGAALENVVPAVPADTFVALGGFLSAVTELRPLPILIATWVGNTASALLMYRLGFTHGQGFFERGWGRRLLNPVQMERMRGFYARWGTPAIFATRFLPGLRAVVPVFAGVSHQRFWPVALPIASASLVWYGALVFVGRWAGSNLDLLRRVLGGVNGVLGIVAIVVAGAIATWWWRTRAAGHE